MKKALKDNRFVSQLTILTLIVIVASILLRAYLTVWWPAIVGFFYIITMVVYFLF